MKQFQKKAANIERIAVPSLTLTSLVKKLGIDQINLLQIDAEGFDAEIVRMAMELPVLPEAINFEHFHIKHKDRDPLFELLRKRGYLVAFDDWNALAVQPSVIE